MDISNGVQLYIQFNGYEIKIPINPEKLKMDKSASNQDIDILGIGKATKKGEPSLTKTEIESFFPATTSPFFELTKTNRNKEGTTPKEYIDFIMWCWRTENVNNNVPKLITVGLDRDFDGMPFVIEDFSYEYNGGDIDVNYTLSIKEYRPYGVKMVAYSSDGMKHNRLQSPFLDTSEPQNTYTVQSGDCLFNITKACCGDGSRWKELYNLNAEIIGDNPNNLKVGQILTLPVGWNVPTKVEKLKPVNKSSSPKNVANPITQEQKSAASTLAKALSEGNVMTYAQASVKNAVIDEQQIHGTGDTSIIFNNANNIIGNNIDVSPSAKLGFWQKYKKAVNNNDFTVLIYDN